MGPHSAHGRPIINSAKRRTRATDGGAHESLITNAIHEHTHTHTRHCSPGSPFFTLTHSPFSSLPAAEYTRTHTLDKFPNTLSFRLTLHFDFVYLRLSCAETFHLFAIQLHPDEFGGDWNELDFIGEVFFSSAVGRVLIYVPFARACGHRGPISLWLVRGK